MKLCVDGVCFNYGSHVVLSDVDLQTGEGDVLSVIGANGAGKSTLLRCINQILTPYRGTVLLDETELRRLEPQARAKTMGYVPQAAAASTPFTVFETVLMGRRPHLSWSVSRHDLAVVRQALEQMEMEELAERHVDELSGGERQKVLIARALVQEPEVILLDEPTSSLDVRHQLEVMEVIHNVAKGQGKCVLMVMHDLNMAARYSDQLLMLKDGLVFAAGEPQTILTPENIRAVYEVEAKVMMTVVGPLVITIKPSPDSACENRPPVSMAVQ